MKFQAVASGAHSAPSLLGIGILHALPLPLEGTNRMAFGFETILAALLAGSAFSLVFSQFFRLLSEMVDLERGDVPRLFVLGLMVLAGPHILAAAARKLGRLREYPWEYVAVIYLVSVVWAGVLGMGIIAAISGAWALSS